MSRKLFVGNVAPEVTRRQLEEVFLSAGVKPRVQIPVNPNSARPRGFAFAEFESPAEAEHVLATLNGVKVGGRALRLGWARESERPVAGHRGRRTDHDRDRQREKVARVLHSVAYDPWDEETGRIDDDSPWRRTRRRKGGKHGSDRLHSGGTRRRFD